MTIIDAGYSVRSASAADFARLTAFIRFYETTVGEFSDFVEEDLWGFSRMERFSFSMGSWMVETAGEIAAFGLAWPHGRGIVYSLAAVHPAHTNRGLGTMCCRRAEARAGELLAPHGGSLRSFVDVKDEAGRALLAGRGYTVARRHYTMARTLPARPPATLPGITIRRARRDEGPLLHDLFEETFSEHWGHAPRTFAEFEAETLERADTDPGLWFVAEAEGEAIGLLLGSIEGPQGWVGILGVRAPWRGRGVGATLLFHAFDEFSRRGATEAALGVDAANATGALRLYEGVGMSARKVYEEYDLSVPGAAPRRG